jgi:hypothetical protein
MLEEMQFGLKVARKNWVIGKDRCFGLNFVKARRVVLIGAAVIPRAKYRLPQDGAPKPPCWSFIEKK